MNVASVDEPTPIMQQVFSRNLMHFNGLVAVIDRDVWIDSVVIPDSVLTGIPFNGRIATSRLLEVPDSIIEARASAARIHARPE